MLVPDAFKMLFDGLSLVWLDGVTRDGHYLKSREDMVQSPRVCVFWVMIWLRVWTLAILGCWHVQTTTYNHLESYFHLLL